MYEPDLVCTTPDAAKKISGLNLQHLLLPMEFSVREWEFIEVWIAHDQSFPHALASPSN